MTMLSRVILCFVVFALFAPMAVAKDQDVPPPAIYKDYPADVEIDAQLLFIDRVTFIKDMYDLSQDDMEKVLAQLQKSVKRQEQYDAGRCVTLKRMRIAIDIVGSDKSLDEKTRQQRVQRFQNQIKRIHAGAPLSFANAIKASEAVLPEASVEAGRKKILAFLVEETGMKADEMDVMQIDQLLAGSVAPGDRPEMPQPPPPMDDGSRLKSRPWGPTPEERARTRRQQQGSNSELPDAVSSKAQQSQKPVAQRPMPQRQQPRPAEQPDTRRADRNPRKPVSPKILDPAPPVQEWRTFYEDAADTYGFSDEQKKAADGVVRNVMSRAAQQQEMTPPDDADARTNTKKRLDRLYDEMKMRVDAIATIEQRQKAEKQKKEATFEKAKTGEE